MLRVVDDLETRPPEGGPPAPRGPSRALIGLILVLTLGGAVAFGARGLASFLSELVPTTGGRPPQVEEGLPVEVEVVPGASARQIGARLVEEGVIDSALEFEIAVRTSGAARDLKAGTYLLHTGMDVDTVLDILLAGPEAVTYWVTVVEGLRIEEVLDSLAAQTPFEVSDLEEALLEGRVESALLEEPPEELADWEGLLFPDTYELVAEASPEDVLGRMAATLERRLLALDLSRLDELGVTPYQAVIVASLVESEGRLDEDRGPIASVIYNRLAMGMALQIDATVLYALGERGIALTLADLEVDSPYNTYRYRGLPPTPIGAPGLASLQAALDPPDTDYLFYVLTDPSGKHSFTASYDEFLRLKSQAREDGVIP